MTLGFSEGPGVPTATLTEILNGGRDLIPQARVDRNTRQNVTLYLKEFNLNPDHLTIRASLGIYALNMIKESPSYQGFVECIRKSGRKIDDNESYRSEPIDFLIGYEKAREMYKHYGSKKLALKGQKN